jgi:capsid portal protein
VALMRMAKLDAAVQVDKEVERDGQVLKFPMWMRERRFVQKIGTEMIFFKEFGSSRDLNRKTGRWAEQGVQLKLEEKASEVIHFTLERDVGTAYGLPRWINQLPSVLGSRKAEEFNLEFFDNGGVPPAVVFLQGGALVEDVKEQLLGYFSGKAAYRVAVVEVQSSTGSIDSTGTVQVKTERFGDTKADAMFTTYDTSTEEHVRVGFRLPPLFLGRAQDYNFATAMTAYMVTEAQVFAPERTEFDEIINKKLLKALGIKNYKYVSKPVTLKNVEVQLKAIELAMDKVDGEKMIETINDIAGLNLEYSKEAHEEAKKLGKPDAFMEGGPFGAPAPTKEAAKGLKPGVNPKSAKVIPLRKNELGPDDVVALVNQWAIAAGLERGQALVDEEKARIFKTVEELSPAQRSLFDNVLATKSFLGVGHDPSGMAAIASCCADMVK